MKQAVRKARESTSEPSAKQQAQEWLEALLEAGPRPAGNPDSTAEQPGTILHEARAAGLAWRTA